MKDIHTPTRINVVSYGSLRGYEAFGIVYVTLLLINTYPLCF